MTGLVGDFDKMVGVLDTKNRDIVIEPELQHPKNLGVQPLGVVVEVQSIDVCLRLRWILRARDAAIDRGGEPFGVRAAPRMIRCTLQREVERDFNAACPRVSNEIVDCAQAWINCIVATVGRSDRGWRARVARLRGGCVVAAFAIDGADRIDWRQIDDVETHVHDRIDALECSL